MASNINVIKNVIDSATKPFEGQNKDAHNQQLKANQSKFIDELEKIEDETALENAIGYLFNKLSNCSD